MNFPVRLALAATLACAASGSIAQTVRATSGPAVVKLDAAAINAAARRASRTTVLPKPAIAIAAQRAMNLPSAPAVNDVAVFDVAHLQIGQANMWTDHVTYASGGTAPILLLGNDGAKSKINITYPASGKPNMIDCEITRSFGEGVPLSATYLAYKSASGASTPLFTGSTPIAMGHITVAVPPAPVAAGTPVVVQITVPGGPSPTDFIMLQACRLYQIG